LKKIYDRKKLKSKKKLTYKVIYIVGILGSLLLSKQLYSKYNPKDYSEILNLYVSILFLIFALLCLYSFLSIKSYYLYKDKFVQKSFLGQKVKSFSFDEIDFWIKEQKEDKYSQWEVLTLYTLKGEKIKISGYFYENYHEIKNELTRNVSRNTKLEESRLQEKDLRYTIGFVIFGLILLFCAYKFIMIKELQSSDIIVFSNKISKDIEVIRGRKKSKSILIKLEKYPEFDFKINGPAFKAIDSENLIEKVKQGDSVFIGIKKADFNRKLIKKDSLTFIDKYFHFKTIAIESITAKKKEYLTLTESNKLRISNRYWGFCFFGIFGSVLFFAGLFMLIQKRLLSVKSKEKTRP
jgi:hypothetical protein